MTNSRNRALITGASSGIGAAFARRLASEGVNLVLVARRLDRLAALAGEFTNIEVETIAADLSSAAGVDLVEQRLAAQPSVDMLINNAGDLVGRYRLEDVRMDFYRKVVAVNLDSNVLVTRAMIPLLKRSGCASIVNLASLAGRKGGHGGSIVYSMTKGAILTLTRALSVELAPYGIRVNAVAPGFILGSAFHAIHTSEESKQATIRDIPLKRAGTCEDVARAVAFLASEYDGFITGATLDINGGVYMA